MEQNVSGKFSLEYLLALRRQFCRKFKQKFPNLVNNLYLICLGVYFTSTFIKSTNMPIYVFSQREIYLLALIPSAIVLLKIFISY